LKTIIIGMAVLMLLLVMAGQIITMQVNEYRIENFDNVLDNHLEEARFKGYFSAEIITSLQNELLSAFPYLEPSDIFMDVTTTPKYKDVFGVYDERERILYDIKVPIEKFFFAAGFLNVEDNGFDYGKSGFVHSEVLR
jgi:hypothetical protein